MPHQASFSVRLVVLSSLTNRPVGDVNLSASSRSEAENCKRGTFTFPVGSLGVDSRIFFYLATLITLTYNFSFMNNLMYGEEFEKRRRMFTAKESVKIRN